MFPKVSSHFNMLMLIKSLLELPAPSNKNHTNMACFLKMLSLSIIFKTITLLIDLRAVALSSSKTGAVHRITSRKLWKLSMPRMHPRPTEAELWGESQASPPHKGPQFLGKGSCVCKQPPQRLVLFSSRLWVINPRGFCALATIDI